jgi:hypothetical protein
MITVRERQKDRMLGKRKKETKTRGRTGKINIEI